MTTFEVRNTDLFLRNSFQVTGKFELPVVMKQRIDLSSVKLIAYSDTHRTDSPVNKSKGVHFFIDDYRFDGIYRNPEISLRKLSQYAFLISPDYSLYREMPKALQIYNVFRNRWVAAYWQAKGLIVIPCISWSDSSSYDFCFDGIQKNSIVAIGMIGCKEGNRTSFLRGYNEMLRRIEPEAIIVFGNPFEEMEGLIIAVDYSESREVDRNGR